MKNNNEFDEEITNDYVELEQEITNDNDELVELTEEMKEKSGGACPSAPIYKKLKLGRMYSLVGDVLKGNMPATKCTLSIRYGFGGNNIQFYYNNQPLRPGMVYCVNDIYQARIGFYDKGPTSGKSGVIIASTTLNINFVNKQINIVESRKININVYR